MFLLYMIRKCNFSYIHAHKYIFLLSYLLENNYSKNIINNQNIIIIIIRTIIILTCV